MVMRISRQGNYSSLADARCKVANGKSRGPGLLMGFGMSLAYRRRILRTFITLGGRNGLAWINVARGTYKSKT